MRALSLKLKPEFKAILKNESTKFPITRNLAIKSLRKDSWLKLTVMECDNLTVLFTEKSFTQMSQILDLFADY